MNNEIGHSTVGLIHLINSEDNACDKFEFFYFIFIHNYY